MLNVIMLNVLMLSVIMLSVIRPNVAMPSVIMLSVMTSDITLSDITLSDITLSDITLSIFRGDSKGMYGTIASLGIAPSRPLHLDCFILEKAKVIPSHFMSYLRLFKLDRLRTRTVELKRHV
jgi:hypothetical protein